MTLANEQYRRHLEVIMKYGSAQEARGLSFVEYTGMTYEVDMSEPVVTLSAREMGFSFAAAEPHWILSGSNLLSEISEYGKMAPYSDDGYMMSGAYGPKIIDQLPYVCRTLAEDAGSRQAVLNIWRERPGKSKDIPCTISMQFMIRDGKLNCYTFMRSSDAIMGLPYDSILFSLVSAYILSIMRYKYGLTGIDLGNLYLFIGSAHVYEKDIDKATKIIADKAIDRKALDDDGQPIVLDFNKLTRVNPSVFLELLAASKDNRRGIMNIGDLK